MTCLAWLATALSLCGNVGVMRKRVWGWWLWIVSNLIWIAYDAYIEAWPQAVLFVIYLMIAVVAVVRWSGEKTGEESA